MDLHDALDLLTTEMEAHGLLAAGWVPHLDRARKRFGYCSYSSRTISIRGPLTLLNERDEVHDTILHEIAHALAWIEHGMDCGHDARWKAICVRIGARPERCYRHGEVQQPAGNWILVHRETGEIFHHYHRRPRRDPGTLYIRGRKDETLGKLTIVKNRDS
ncbi:MAG: SprT-like domain-containing protein [Verrucomicrobiota bacterium JB023]|nr:SprT-like domain-containing protein [Verrucomicrobiota bacterium JB023]